MTTTRMIVLVVAVLVAGCGESGPVTNFGAGGSTSMNGGSPGSTGGAAMAAGGSNPSGTGGTVQPGTGGNIGAGGAITTGTGGVSGTGASMGTGGKPSTTGTGGAPQGGSSGTGGKPVTTGGTTGTGSNTGTGGATPGTGGKPATGTGGATPGTGGMITSTGGAPLGTGGNVGTGGMIASTGGNTGTGGMITSTGGAPANTGGAPGTGGTMPMMTPFSCSGFDTEFPFPGRVWDIASFGATNTYAVGEEVGQTQIGHLVHWNGNTATEQTLPVPANSWVVALYSVWGSSSNDVWAGGYIRTQLSGAPDGVGPVTPAVYHRVNGGAWQRDTTISFGSNVKTVVSITGSSASDVFVTAKVWDGDANEDVVIFRKNGSSWTQMSLPAHTLPTRIVRLAIISGKLYAVGYRLTGDPLANDAIQGILWYFDGAAWSNITTLPSDVIQLEDVSGADGQVVVVGRSRSGGVDKGVRLVSSDRVSWSVSSSSETYTEGAVFMPRIGAAISVGITAEPNGQIAIMSKNTWSTMGPGLYGARATRPIPGTSQVLVGAENGVVHATCQ